MPDFAFIFHYFMLITQKKKKFFIHCFMMELQYLYLVKIKIIHP